MIVGAIPSFFNVDIFSEIYQMVLMSGFSSLPWIQLTPIINIYVIKGDKPISVRIVVCHFVKY
jgi:hypothetical protein